MALAQKAWGMKTKKDAVNAAFKEVIERRRTTFVPVNSEKKTSSCPLRSIPWSF